MDMLAAVTSSINQVEFKTCQLTEPAENEVLVKVNACGICHTDLLALSGQLGTPLPAILGHEGVGTVIALGQGVTEFAIGDSVIISFGACGLCSACSRQQPAYCHHGMTLNLLGRRLTGQAPASAEGLPLTSHFFGQSSFASHAIARTTNLVKIDNSLLPELMAPLACGMQTGAASVVNVLKARQTDTLMVMGCGTVGLAAIMTAARIGCHKIIAVDIKPERLELALALGATSGFEAIEQAKAKKAELGFIDKVLDTTGKAEVISKAFSLLSAQGTLALAGVSHPNEKLEIRLNDLLFSGRKLVGTIEGNADPRTFIPQMIDWYRAGQFPIDKLVKTYSFNDIHQALADMQAGAVVKPVLLM